MDLFPIKFTGQISGVAAIAAAILLVALNGALWFGVAVLLAFGAQIGWSL